MERRFNMNGIIFMTFFLALAGVAYMFVVIFPLLGIVFGVLKASTIVRRTVSEKDFVKYEEGLGFTMADGGEKGDN